MEVMRSKCAETSVPANVYSPEVFAVLDTFTEAQRNAIVATGNLHLSLFTILR